MKNIMADGVAEDLIRGFVQISCAEIHAKTLFEKYHAQMENGLIDLKKDLEAHTEKINDITEELSKLAELRREIMRTLFEMYDGDKDWHCMVKHLGAGAYTLFEAYQASDDDPAIYAQALEANKRFIHALTHYLGQEVTECSACFSDMMRKENEDG